MSGQRLTFGQVRGYFSRVDRLCVSFDDRTYVPYLRVSEVPSEYDSWELRGFGVATIEFDEDWDGQRRVHDVVEFWLMPGERRRQDS